MRRLAQYGITPEEYDDLWEAQQGLCAICGTPGGARKLAVDHDHATGVRRELLCSKCNVGIGQFDDNPALLERAIEYLRKHGPIDFE